MGSAGTARAVPAVVRALTLVLVLAVLAAVVAWQQGYLGRWLADGPAPGADPAAVAPPPGLDLPAVTAPDPVARPATAGAANDLDPAAVRRAVAPYLHDRSLGRDVRALVAPLAGGPAAYSLGSGAATPASTTKLATTSAALLALGPEHRFTTKVVGGRREVMLVGGGDPYLERQAEDPDLAGVPVGADVATLAARTARWLATRHVKRIRVGYDDTLFTGPAVNPFWEEDYVPDGVVSPISSLWVDEGRDASRYGHVSDPALEAGRVFAAALVHQGIGVVGAPTPARAPVHASTVAAMRSAPLSQIVEHVLEVSDNEGAEVLLRQTGLVREGHGSFTAGARARAALLRENGIDLTPSDRLYDGSGLSRHDRLQPDALLDVLRLAASAAHPQLRAVITGLPVAGFSGSLADRMDHGPPAGLGRVEAKTGTLTGVSSLAGIAQDLDGDVVVFVLMADRVALLDTHDAREALDDAAAALGACHCSSHPG